MVDWDLAGRTARKLISAGPARRPARRPPPSSASCTRRPPSPSRTSRSLTGMRPVARRPGARGRRRRPARLGRRQHQRHGGPARPAGRRADREAGQPPRARWPPPSAPAPPASRPAACSPSCPRRVLGQYEVFGTGGRLLLVAPEHRGGRAQAGRRPGRLPALGLPARGHPPAAVHRRPVAAARTSSREIAAVRRGHRPHRRRPAASGCRTCCAASPTPSAGERRRLRGAAWR